MKSRGGTDDINRLAVILIVLIAMVSSCRPEPDAQLTLTVHLQHAYDAAPVPDVDLELERRVLENGVLNGNYQWVGAESTNEQGVAQFLFNRVNALDYQVNLLSEDWFERTDWIHPDVFLTNSEVELEIAATPRGTVHIELINQAPGNELDVIQFRTLNIPGEYTTCSNAWESHDGTVPYIERTCDVEADRYLPFRHHVTRNNQTIETLDSIWIPRGETTSLQIVW